MADLTVNLCGVQLKNPVIAASGTFGFGLEFMPWFDINLIGGMSLKALTINPREGNPPPRIAESASGMMNAVGLQNPGVDRFISDIWPKIEDIENVKIANVAGADADEYIAVIERLNALSLDMYELNISCPNVKHGGAQFGSDPRTIEDITRRAKRAARKPLIVKLSPNVTSIADAARAAEAGGADAISLINTLTGMAIDARMRRPIIANRTGGLSGPAIKPVGLRMVWETYNAVSIPIIGMGGIMTGEDAAEFMIAGASAVMVGTASIVDPVATLNIARELDAFLDEQGILTAAELTGTLKV